jgi:myo-inositol 2-dehydrogenase / D-chiro-inositol 1-dehydrogenase
MKNRLNLAVIGVGRMGSVHVRNLIRRIPQANVVAICDIRPDVAQKVASELGIREVVTDYHQLLIDDRVEAVLIAASTDVHAEMVANAARAGKHIFCEKPLALDLPSIDDALAAVDQARVKLQVGFNRRFDPSFQRVREIVASGAIGRPCILRIASRDPEPPSVAYAKASGGMFLDMTIHDFDMARFMVGEVEEVYALGSVLVAPWLAEAGDVDTDIVTLRFANGALGVIDNSRQAVYGYDQRLEVFCSAGVAQADNQAVDTVVSGDRSGMHAALPPRFFMQRYPETYVNEVREFIDCVLNDREPSVTGRDGKLSVVMGYAAWKSWRENRPVKLTEI